MPLPRPHMGHTLYVKLYSITHDPTSGRRGPPPPPPEHQGCGSDKDEETFKVRLRT